MTTQEKNLLLAVFEDIDPAAHAVDSLRALGVADAQVTVISGTPITEAMMGRKPQWSNVARFALGGAAAGMGLGIFLAFGTPSLYPVYVGGQPLIPVPPTIVVLFETTMLVMLISTFLGVFLDSRFPNFTPMEYVPEISDGRIALLIECAPELEKKVEAAMQTQGAESIRRAQAEVV
jgi:hypothetical protein